MSRLLEIEAYARPRLDVAPSDVMKLLGCSKIRARRLLRLMVELRRMHRVEKSLFVYGDRETSARDVA